MYSLPSTSQMRAPWPRAMKTGSPPTDLKARTGELTPPAMCCCASANSSCERVSLLPGILAAFTLVRAALAAVTVFGVVDHVGLALLGLGLHRRRLLDPGLFLGIDQALDRGHHLALVDAHD